MITASFILGLASLPALAATLFALPIVAFLAFYVWVTPNSLKDPRRKKLPPGPRGLPFLGNYLDLAKADTFRFQVQEWSRKYGEIWYTKMGSSDYIWLSSPKAVKTLMDQRSSIYSSRPPTPLAGDTASAGRRQLFMAYGPAYRVVRKIAAEHHDIN
jgi:cytochrome P450